MIQFQGDVAFIEIPAIPPEAKRTEPENGRHIVAHSETGHHHYINAADAVHFDSPTDPNVCYLQMLADSDVVHDRSWDTHAPISLKGDACYIGIRQVEKSPEGWRRVAD